MARRHSYHGVPGVPGPGPGSGSGAMNGNLDNTLYNKNDKRIDFTPGVSISGTEVYKEARAASVPEVSQVESESELLGETLAHHYHCRPKTQSRSLAGSISDIGVNLNLTIGSESSRKKSSVINFMSMSMRSSPGEASNISEGSISEKRRLKQRSNSTLSNFTKLNKGGFAKVYVASYTYPKTLGKRSKSATGISGKVVPMRSESFDSGISINGNSSNSASGNSDPEPDRELSLSPMSIFEPIPSDLSLFPIDENETENDVEKMDVAVKVMKVHSRSRRNSLWNMVHKVTKGAIVDEKDLSLELAVLQKITQADLRFAVQLKESYIKRGKVYIVTELCALGDLTDFMNDCNALHTHFTGPGAYRFRFGTDVSQNDIGHKVRYMPLRMVRFLIAPIFSALAALHSIGLADPDAKVSNKYYDVMSLSPIRNSINGKDGYIHRDIKPENILLTADGTPKLADFGAVKYTDGRTYIKDDSVFGSAYFMAPETICRGSYNASVDTWQIGITMLTLAFGWSPYSYRRNDVLFDESEVADTGNKSAKHAKTFLKHGYKSAMASATSREEHRENARCLMELLHLNHSRFPGGEDLTIFEETDDKKSIASDIDSAAEVVSPTCEIIEAHFMNNSSDWKEFVKFMRKLFVFDVRKRPKACDLLRDNMYLSDALLTWNNSFVGFEVEKETLSRMIASVNETRTARN